MTKKPFRGVVYIVRCTAPGGLIYVGQTVSALKLRWWQHVSDAKHKGFCRSLAEAIREHGRDAFTIAELVACSSQDALDAAEREAILAHGSLHPGGYNLGIGGRGPGGFFVEESRKRRTGQTGRECSPETRAKMSAAKKGRPRVFTLQHRASLRRDQLRKRMIRLWPELEPVLPKGVQLRGFEVLACLRSKS